MIPINSIDDPANVCRAYTEALGKGAPGSEFCSVKLPNFSNVLLCKLCLFMSFTSRQRKRMSSRAMTISASARFRMEVRSISVTDSMAAFCNHIRNIIQIGSKEQVAWVATWRVVAFMQHPQPVRNVTEVQEICDSTGNVWLPIYSATSIAIPLASSPGPASIWPGAFIDFRPKTSLLLFSDSNHKEKTVRRSKRTHGYSRLLSKIKVMASILAQSASCIIRENRILVNGYVQS